MIWTESTVSQLLSNSLQPLSLIRPREGFLGVVLTSSVAKGNKYQHKHEEETLLKEALGLHVDELGRTTKGVQ